MTNNDLVSSVITWAYARNLITGSTPDRQVLKLVEEVGELASGIAKADHKEIVDAIGDVLVVLIILSEQLNLNIFDALKVAYNEIKDRKGVMKNGVFVKEEDLETKERN